MGEAKRRRDAGQPPRFRGNFMPSQDIRIESPLCVMFRNESGSISCHIHPADGMTHQEYGLLICDLVRHVARAYRVDEEDVWEWVEKERDHPTTDIKNPS